MNVKQVGMAIGLGVGLALAALCCLASATGTARAQAGTGVIRVATSGTDASGCGGAANPCATVQYAVDLAGAGDEVRVATGVYTGVLRRAAPPGYDGAAVVTQVVYISKTVALRGGYTTTDWNTSDPISYPTTLDAGEQGRVLFIAGEVSPTVEGLIITGGSVYGADGGGIYTVNAALVLSDCRVSSNVAELGGGLFLYGGSVTFTNNIIASNIADTGGGLGLIDSIVVFNDGVVAANVAKSIGGGLWLFDSDVTFRKSHVTSNVSGSGGGLVLDHCNAVINENVISSNVATGATGGGISLWSVNAVLDSNIISANTAQACGGGLELFYNSSILSNNTIVSNTASWGSGLCLHSLSDVTLINNVIAENQASTTGSGVGIWNSSLRLLHTTIARNKGGDGSGIYITNTELGYSMLTMTSTILVSHTVGISVTAGSTATLEATLWGTGTWSNGADWGGAGTISTGTVNLWGDPAFLDPDGGDYHLTASSAAIDAGMDVGVDTDVDGEPRPVGAGYDIGADEYWVPLSFVYLPLVLKDGK